MNFMTSAAVARFRICRVDGEEHPDSSWQRAEMNSASDHDSFEAEFKKKVLGSRARLELGDQEEELPSQGRVVVARSL